MPGFSSPPVPPSRTAPSAWSSEAAQRYRVGEGVSDGPSSRVLRAWRVDDDTPVIFKQMRELYPPPAALARFTREFEVTRAAAGPGVVGAHELFSHEGRVTMVLEDFGGRSLASICAEARLPLADALDVAAQVARALASLHRLDIVHRDVNPTNLVWCRRTGVVKLIDFSIAQVLSHGAVGDRPLTRIEGTPAYLSPEQTGRMNRPVDHRSDLYSLGATLYELLVVFPPFAGHGALELVFAHLAKTPPSPRQIDPSLPEPVSDLVMQLLKKSAEERYQSASGLADDLDRCREQLRRGGAFESFELRSRDVDERLRLPQKLYGRDAELSALQAAFERAAGGRTAVALVGGQSGVGKTSLVRELRRLLSGRGVAFVEGKVDQFARGTPYDPFLQLFRELIARMLDADRVEPWKERLLGALGGHGGVLASVLPEVERVLGPQPLPEPLPPAEARNRFRLVMTAFVRAMASASRPLLLFVDDLQWADVPSIELLGALAADPTCRHVLLVGAYRSNEVDGDHPLLAAVAALRAQGVEPALIELDPLGEQSVAEYISDALAGAPGHRELASSCYAQTRGNPFYLGRLLGGLRDDGFLFFDGDRRTWRWSLEAVRAQPMTETVVELLSSRIQRLPAEARRALELGACAGDPFDLAALAFALGASRKAALAALRPSLAAELLQPVDEGFWFVGDADEATTNFSWRFVHDRVRQAAYALLPGEEAAAAHLALGRFALASLAEQPRRLFEVVEHLNRGSALIDDPAERERLVELNLEAGRRALASAAFAPAHAHYQQAARLLDAGAWGRRYELALSVHVEGARAAYLAGKRDEMEALVEGALAHGRELLDRALAQEVKIHALVAEQRFLDAIALALSALSQLGVQHPAEPTDAQVQAAVAAAVAAIQSLIERGGAATLGPTADPLVAAAARIQNAIMTSAYLAAPRLLPLLAGHIVQATLAHGVCKESAYGFAIVALVLVASNQIDLAYATGQIALSLLDSIDDRSAHPKPLHVVSCHVKPFVDPIRASLDDCRRVFALGLDTGDLEYAAWALHNMCCNGLYAGLALAELEPMIERNLATCRQHRQLPAVACTQPFLQAVQNLLNKAPDPARLVGPDYDESAQMQALSAQGFRGAAFILTTLGCYVRFLFRDLAGAVAHADEGGHFADGATATQHVIWWHQYRTLAALGLLHPGSEGCAEAIASLAPHLTQLKVWMAASAVNSAHRVHLIEAEIARVEGRVGDAVEGYDLALAEARAGGFPHEEALACELAGRFHLARRSRITARAYLLEACHAYERWGAAAKAQQLEEEFSSLIGGLGRDSAASSRRLISAPPVAVGDDALDLDTLFKAANLISSEKRLDRLLDRVLDVLLENTGATRGFLLLGREGSLVVEAAKDAEGNQLVTPRTAAADCELLPPSIVNHAARTGDRLVLSDARSEPRWAADPRVARDHPTSVLCAPLIHNGLRSGLIYLENHLTEGAFTPARIRVLGLLASQAAISIENARLYDTLEQRVRDRTRELQESLALVVQGQRKLAAELRDAAAYIRSLLPLKLRQPVEIDWRFLPSDELGGDAFGYHLLPDGRLAVYLLDVCGHGVAAALLSISVLSTLSSQRLAGVDFGDPAQVLHALNQAFPCTQHGSLFFTAWYGVIDVARRHISFASGGHPGAVLLTGPSEARLRPSELETGGPALGLVPDVSFEASSARLDAVARLFVFSDGAYEIVRQDGSLLPYGAFVAELTSRLDSLPETLDRMVRLAYRASGRDTLDDDFSMVALALPPPASLAD